MSEDDRNPLVIPQREDPRRKCPKCGDPDNFTGRRIQGTILFKCKCGAEFGGGLPQEPLDPRVPYPPDPNPPLIQIGRDSTGEPTEIRRRPDLRQEFRKGAPFDNEE